VLKSSVHKLLNKQVNAEFYSSFLYLSMASWFEFENLPGIASWMKIQAKEEHEHGMKIFNHILERGEKVVLEAIQAPPASYSSAEAVFKKVVEHERHVTELIHKIVGLAREEKDYATESFLDYFVKEQVEEEAQAKLIYEQVKMLGSSKGSLLMLDHRLGKRGEEPVA
jgi:ferritin